MLTLRPATLAGGKVSFRARVKAFSMTRLQVASERWGARFPRRMVVLARIGGSSSTCKHMRAEDSSGMKQTCIASAVTHCVVVVMMQLL